MKTNQFELGSTLRDTVSGFTGIAIARVEFLNGCIQYCIKPKVDKDGKQVDGEYLDSQQLEFVDDGLNKQVAASKTSTGGASHNEHNLPR